MAIKLKSISNQKYAFCPIFQVVIIYMDLFQIANTLYLSLNFNVLKYYFDCKQIKACKFKLPGTIINKSTNYYCYLKNSIFTFI